jgi:hypothetical protein
MDSPMEPRRVGRSTLNVVVASPLFVTAPLWRRWHQRWGATDEEVRGPMPGDDILAKPSFNATRAVTIKASPDRVWPWIVQIGYDRAGFYSYDLFDHGARPSSRRIVPEFQQLKVGDWVAMYSRVNDATAFECGRLCRRNGCCGASRTAPGPGSSSPSTVAGRRGW